MLDVEKLKEKVISGKDIRKFGLKDIDINWGTRYLFKTFTVKSLV